MATSYAEIGEHLKALGMKFEHQNRDGDERIVLAFSGADHYRDKDGDPVIFVVIRLDEDGEYVKIYAPNCYRYKDGPNRLAVFETCLAISWKTKLIQFEYDMTDGEVRVIVEWPLEDAPVTRKQLDRCLRGLANLIDKNHPVFEKAMATGVVEFPADPDDTVDEEIRRRILELQALLEGRSGKGVKPADIQMEE